ncbi:MAG: RNA polymerase sigma factor [Microthrixaceae bacterium]|nr:RNA polymerase sigma factor [Microthrixaceae bacterium]
MDAENFAAQALSLYNSIVRAVYAYCGDETLAQDSAQEALARGWQRVDAGASIDSLQAWTMTVAFNWCRSELRRSESRLRDTAKSERLNNEGHAVELAVQSNRSTILSHETLEILLTLPERQRQVLALHYLVGMDIAAMAEVAGISQGAVKNALFNGRAAMRSRLLLEDHTGDTR